MRKTHFYATDRRFCGSADPIRQVSHDSQQVTCPACKKNDIVMTPEWTWFLETFNGLEQCQPS